MDDDARADLIDEIGMVGEAFEGHGRLKQALRWFSLANRDIYPSDHDQLDSIALSGRRRVRQELGLPEDKFDLAADEIRTQWLARRDGELLVDP